MHFEELTRNVRRAPGPPPSLENETRWFIATEVIQKDSGRIPAWTERVQDNVILRKVHVHIDPSSPGQSLQLSFLIRTGFDDPDGTGNLDTWERVVGPQLGGNFLSFQHNGVEEQFELDMVIPYRTIGRRFGFEAVNSSQNDAIMWVGFLLELVR